MQKAILRLFNSIQIPEDCVTTKPTSKSILKRTLKNGYILAPSIIPTEALLSTIESVVGINGEKVNAAFHKSWATIQNTPQEILWLQASIHYITTYGFNSLGVYNDNTMYIPNEKLELPEITENIPLIYINGITAREVLYKILDLSSGIALAQSTLDDILLIISNNNYDNSFVSEVKNKELKALLYAYYGITPVEPVEFLMHLITKLTNESLLIKNNYLIEKIKEANGKFLDELLQKAPSDLASIFFRFKPLFLAMKKISKNKTFFNKLRKQANKLHKPMPEDYLNNVTNYIKKGTLNITLLQKELAKATIFRKIRLAYALKFRQNATNSIVYRIRNGSGWATEFNWESEHEVILEDAYNTVIKSIISDFKKNKYVNGRIIYIPENINYALPATEKQFTGFIPTGSYVVVPENMIVGIHWCNTDNIVDLDLSIVDAHEKTGWDSTYGSQDGNILFSGDMTSAPKPKGASELFYFKKEQKISKIMMVNYYNFEKGDKVETKLFVAHEKVYNFSENYMVDINNIIASANINITKKQNVLGIITNVEGKNRFYFSNVSIGNSISATVDEKTEHTRNYLINSLIKSIDLKDMLKEAGAAIITKKLSDDNEYADEVIDLSPEALDKTTLINLITGG